MEVLNTFTYKNLPFEEYIKLGGLSFSTLKHGEREIEPTYKMRLGSQVDCFCFEPHRYKPSDEFPEKLIRSLAIAIKMKLGSLWNSCIFQMSIQSEFYHNGFMMRYRGRPDIIIKDKLVIDLKVSEKVNTSFFGYEDQLSGYALPLKIKKAIILSVNPKTFEAKWEPPIQIKTDWWDTQVLKYGEPVNIKHILESN